MLTGRVTSDREALVVVDVHGDEGQVASLEATIDTGYDGFLTLPRSMVEDLGLSYLGPARAALGDGNEVRMDVFVAAVQWEGGSRDVLVLEAEGEVLVGMAMLVGLTPCKDIPYARSYDSFSFLTWPHDDHSSTPCQNNNRSSCSHQRYRVPRFSPVRTTSSDSTSSRIARFQDPASIPKPSITS